MKIKEFYEKCKEEAGKYNLGVICGVAKLSRNSHIKVPAVVLTGFNKETTKKEFSWVKIRIEKRKDIFCLTGVCGKREYYDDLSQCVCKAVKLYHEQIKKKFFDDMRYTYTPEPLLYKVLTEG